MKRLHVTTCLLFLSVIGRGVQRVSSGPRVVAVYPAGDNIPANVLRFYVQFSRPMREGDAPAGIRLTNMEGVSVDSVFFDNNYELWNEDRTILTLLVDPARVKTGLLANRRMGLAFQPGRRYILLVSTRFRTMSGDTLAEPFHKVFSVVSPQLGMTGPDGWAMDIPTAASREPLIIHFPAAMDHLSVTGNFLLLRDGQTVAGQPVLFHHDSAWLFRPERPWSRARYRLVVNRRLEDVAGNSLYGPFESNVRPDKKRDSAIVNRLFFIN